MPESIHIGSEIMVVEWLANIDPKPMWVLN